MKEKHAKDKGIASKILVVIRIICIIVIIGCLIYIFQWYRENKKNSNMLAELTDNSVKDTVTIQLPVDEEVGENQQQEECCLDRFSLRRPSQKNIFGHQDMECREAAQGGRGLEAKHSGSRPLHACLSTVDKEAGHARRLSPRQAGAQ